MPIDLKNSGMRIAVLGAGAGAAAAVVELAGNGHEVSVWARSPASLMPFRDGIRHEGVLGRGCVPTLGQIGFEGRFDYAAIGSVPNLASRLCGEAKNGQILISQRV